MISRLIDTKEILYYYVLQKGGVNMSIVSLRLNNEEKEILEEASKVYGIGVSSMIKKLVFEALEDQYDLQVIVNYEKQKEAGTLNVRPIEELWKETNLL